MSTQAGETDEVWGTSPPPDEEFLSLCAILQSFDLSLLRALTSVDEATLRRFLASEQVLLAPDEADRWQLQPALRDMLRARLRAEAPHEAQRLHARAFDALLPTDGGRTWPERDESACFYHLAQLYFLLFQQQGWQTVQELVERARRAAPQQARHLHRLELYDAYRLLYASHFADSAARFHGLLGHENLESYTHLRALNGLALVAMYRTEHDEALQWLQHLHLAARAAADLTYQGVALINQSTVLMDLSYYPLAVERADEALTIYRTLGERSLEIFALLTAGQSLLHLGHWAEAEQRLEQAATLAETLALPALAKNAYWAQGLLNHLRGRPQASEALYGRALAIARAPETRNERIESDTLWHLGFLLHTQRRDEEALHAYEAALRIAAALGRTHWQSLILYQRGDLLKRQGRLDAARATFEQAIRLIEGLRGDSPTEQVKLGLLGTTQQLYEAMVRLCVAEGRHEEAFHFVERARSQAFLDQLRQKDPALYDALDQPAVTLAEVQAALPEGTLLLEFFTSGVLPPGESLLRNLPPESAPLRDFLLQPPTTLLFAITRDSFACHTLPLDPNPLQPPAGTRSPLRRLLRPRQLRTLYTTLLAPVAAQIASHKLLYLVPHGPLHYVPWMALQGPDGRFLLDEQGPAIALAPSATLLLRNCLKRPRPQGGDFLALGYNDEGEEALRYAETEARLLARRMGGSAWVGEEPKLEALAARASGLRWLHISGHGLFHPQRPLDSQLRLGKGDAPTARDLMRALRLSVELVTLSACTSGLNQIVAGDELLGLPRAFLYAGAPTVVCTPWEAADLVALLVMERFYQALQRGTPPAEALRDAQVAIRTMTGDELLATLERWRREYPEEAKELPSPSLSSHELAQPLFAAPEHWALFTLIGRGS